MRAFMFANDSALWPRCAASFDDRAEAAGPILNKAGQFAASPALRAILGQHAPKFDLAYAMENRGILDNRREGEARRSATVDAPTQRKPRSVKPT